MPTLQDVAKKAGVSTATVSKVLSNTPYFSDATRDKVMLAVEEVGYIPNLAARALTSGKTQIIAVVFPYVYETIFEDVLIMSILKGIEAECKERHYNILLSTPRIDDDGVETQFHTMIQSGYADGIICIDSIHQASVGKIAQAKGVPSVVIGHHHSPYFVRCNDFTGAQELTELVLALGHKHIGIISIPSHTHMGIDERLSGIHTAAFEANQDADAYPIEYGDYSMQSGFQAAQQLIAKYPELSAIISINDRMALGAIQYLQQIGKSIPQDMTVVGYDNIELSQLYKPALTTVDQRPTEQGHLAAQILFDVLAGKTPHSVVLDPLLVLRESTAKPYSSI